MDSFSVGNATFGSGGLAFILGPCVVESVHHALFMAQEIKDICSGVGVDVVYKSSFDKANRSSIESFRGEGMQFGLDILGFANDSIGIWFATTTKSGTIPTLQLPATLAQDNVSGTIALSTVTSSVR